MNIRILIISIITSFSLSIGAQVISVQTDFSRDTIAIGEQLEYQFRLETGPTVQSDLPLFYDTLSTNIEILEMLGIDTTFDGQNRTITGKYLVTSFEKGMNIVSPKPVKFKVGDIQDTAYTLPLVLEVVAPVIDTSLAIKPIKPPINTPVSFREVYPWALSGLGVLLLAYLVFVLLRKYMRKKKDPELFYRKPKEPAHIIALRNLDKLKEDNLMEPSQSKEYYSRLTEIVRRYISDQYGIHTMESTSSEILNEFKQVYRDNTSLNEMLEGLLELADLVKFAKEDPLRKEKERHLDSAYAFVNETYNLIITEEMEQADELKSGDSVYEKIDKDNIA